VRGMKPLPGYGWAKDDSQGGHLSGISRPPMPRGLRAEGLCCKSQHLAKAGPPPVPQCRESVFILTAADADRLSPVIDDWLLHKCSGRVVFRASGSFSLLLQVGYNENGRRNANCLIELTIPRPGMGQNPIQGGQNIELDGADAEGPVIVVVSSMIGVMNGLLRARGIVFQVGCGYL
jgi:hypothetical protein